MKISIIHPSRNRPEMAIKTYHHWRDNMSGDVEHEYILSIDQDDSKWPIYFDLFEYKAIILQNNNRSLIDATNQGAKISKGNILVLVSDDFMCYPNWDLDIVKAFEGQNEAVLKTYDGAQKWIVTLPIMDRAYYTRAGFFYNPEYLHMFSDTEMTHKADIEGKLIFRNDLIFTHAHYSTGMNKKDEVNEKADKTWNQGEALYLQRAKNNFGLSPHEIVRGISPEGKSHQNWLKAKI